jgi:hypothetical protein
MIEASGHPDDPDNPIRLEFDPDSPADTVAYVRRPAGPAGPQPAATTGEGSTEPPSDVPTAEPAGEPGPTEDHGPVPG